MRWTVPVMRAFVLTDNPSERHIYSDVALDGKHRGFYKFPSVQDRDNFKEVRSKIESFMMKWWGKVRDGGDVPEKELDNLEELYAQYVPLVSKAVYD